jgi:hypothetical protein
VIFLTDYYGFSVLVIHLEPTLGMTLVVSATSIAVMVVTLFEIPKVSSNNSVTSEDVQSPSQGAEDTNITYLKFIFRGLLTLFSLGIVVFSVGAFVGFASVNDIWDVLKMSALVETLVLSYFWAVKNK